MRGALCDLLKRTGSAISMAHATGSEYALQATDACSDFVAGHFSLEDDRTPFASYKGGTRGQNTTIPYRPYGLSNISLRFDHPVTDPSQLNKETVDRTDYTESLLSNYSCILQASPAKQLPNVAKAPLLCVVSKQVSTLLTTIGKSRSCNNLE